MPSANARADIAPPAAPAGAGPEVETRTDVRMMSEQVIMEVRLGDAVGMADVKASFIMRNLGQTAEQLRVRFPLDSTTDMYRICDVPFDYPYAPIQGLTAEVDGVPVAVDYTTVTVELPAEQPPYPTVTRLCWANFEVLFPPGRDVSLVVRYQVEPQVDNGVATYSYILETGSGWNGTIGSGTIELILPYDLSQDNVWDCRPEPICRRDGRRLQWTFSELEPEWGDNVRAVIVSQVLWTRILNERERVVTDPNDHEAWGRLARAYKLAILERRGFTMSDPGIRFYRLSAQAYERTLALAPDDADWHFGYAELLCLNAQWNLIDATLHEATTACLQQLQATIALNPTHERATQLLDEIATGSLWVDPTPVVRGPDGYSFPFLTATPVVEQPVAAASLAVAPTVPLPTATPPAPATITPTPPPATLAPVATPTPLPSAPSPSLPGWIVPAVLGLVGLIVALLFVQRKGARTQ